MKTAEEIKLLVKEKYGAIALSEKGTPDSSCCGSACCTDDELNMSDDYSKLDGYNPEADLGLGCGLPTEFAKIKKGDVVVDLGSGAGNDSFIARNETGEDGKVIGIDMTEQMITKARINAEKLNFNNVEFRFGEIDNIPVSDSFADVVVSNCVLNLVPDKENAFNEIFRILKPGGHFSISDIVIIGELPAKIQEAAEMIAGCVSGAIQKEKYLQIIKAAGFTNVTIQKEKSIKIPDDVLLIYLSGDEINLFRKESIGIFSITVYGEKKSDECCNKEVCCK